MPPVLGFLLPWAIRLVAKFGLPMVEKRWPALKPIVDEILSLMGGAASDTALPPVPTPHLMAAAAHYNERAQLTPV